ncbi:VPA1262 family protein [Pseudomonas psychrophila]|uniref:VPA1262 family protein n=1 Tax=Pseudomonas psychrophila TaxID=122355 RepID=UPI00381B2967
MTTELKDLIEDPLLGRLFTDSGRACAFQIWIAQIQTDDRLENRFVYGRLLPYSFSSGAWSAPSDDKFETVGGCRAQVIRATLYLGSDRAGELLCRLGSGDSISEVSSSLGFKMSDSLKKRIGAFSLNDSFVCRPAVLLLNRDAHESIGPQSPHGSASAFSAAITTVDKERLFITSRGLDPAMARFLVKRMNADTGLDFASKDAARFSDLELLVFPTLDDRERELLDLSWADERKTLVVKLNLLQLEAFSSFYVQAQIMNNGQRVFSGVTLVHRGTAGTIECRFELKDGLWDIADSAEIEIHGTNGASSVATLCCAWKSHYIREISISGGAVSPSSGEVKLGWLDKALKKTLRGSTRVKSAQAISRAGVGFSSTVGGRQADPWVAANRSLSELLSILHPSKSEARFFGRLSEGDGTERLRFAEWIKQQFSKYQDHQVIFFDPYFEDAGIGLFVPNASAKGEYIIFTTVSSKSSTPKIQSSDIYDDLELNRIDNLLASCNQLQNLVRRIDLKIFGVKSGALHDRYLLVADRRGLPVAGFNLSNSIQKANEDHPLLITPIPMDALHEVFNYATKLISRAANGASAESDHIEPIFDSKRQVQPVLVRDDRLEFIGRELAGSVLAAWTGNDSLRGLYGEDLRTQMSELCLLDGESLRIPKTPGLEACIKGLSIGEDYSQEWWEVVAETLAHTPSGDTQWAAIGALNISFIDFLEGVLNDAFLRISDVPNDTSFASVEPRLFQQDLEIFLCGSYSYEHFRYTIKYPTLTWADVYAVKILWGVAPEKLVKVSERYAATLDNEAHHRDAIKLSLLSQIVGEVSFAIAIGINNEQKESLLQSANGFLKWMGLASLRDASKSLSGAKQVVERLASFDQQESIRIMCWLLSGLAKVQGSEMSFGIVRQALYDALPPMLGKKDADSLVSSLLGHMRKLGWSEPWLFTQVIAELLEDCRVTPDDLVDIWVKELFSYFEGKLIGDSYYFDRSREGRVTEIAAFLLARSSVEVQRKTADILWRTLKKASGNVQQPLASTMNWQKWNCSLEVAMWVYAFCRHVEHYEEESDESPKQFDDIRKLSMDVAMIRTLEEWRSNGAEQGALAAFIEEIGEVWIY